MTGVSETMNQTITFQQLPAIVQQLIQSRRLEDAFTVVKAFLDQGAAHFQSCYALGLHAVMQGEEPLARDVCTALEQSCGDNAEAWKVIAGIAHKRHEWRQLIRAVDQCAALGGDPGAGWLLKARALTRLGDVASALTLLDEQTPQHGQDPAQWHYARAEALIQQGQYDAVVQLLEPYLPQAPAAVGTIGSWKLLGKAYDKLKQTDKAWLSCERGNALAQAAMGTPLSVNPFLRRVAAMAEVIRPEWVASWPSVPAAERSPVFLIGFPRSGTTLLDQILNAHPQIVTLEERYTVEKVWDAVAPMLTLDDPALASRTDEAGLKLRQQAELQKIAELTPDQVCALRAVYERAVAGYVAWPPGQVFVDKLPLATVSMALILRLYPEARFLVALRHPGDVLVSNFMQDFELNPGMQPMLALDSAAQLYADMMALLAQTRDAFGLDQQVMTIRYEDVVEDMAAEARRMIDFLGLDWDEQVMDFAAIAKARGNLGTPSFSLVTQGIRKDLKGRWQAYREPLAPVLPLLAPACEQFGYSLAPAST